MRKLAVIALVAVVTMALTVSAAAATDADVGYITLDDTHTSLHYYNAVTTPQAHAWGEENKDVWELTVATSCDALVHIEWFDWYPTQDVYELWVDGVSKGKNAAGGTGQADVWLAAGSHTIVVDWLFYRTNQPLIPGGSFYDITFTVTDQDCMPTGAITSPNPGAIIFIGNTLTLGATYSDDDPGGVDWAVRRGTCAANTNTVAGNVDGFHDVYSWDGSSFSAALDTGSWVPGDYCFIFNPREDGIEPNMRLTREFKILIPATRSCPAGEMFVSSVGTGSATPVVASGALTNGVKYTAAASGVYYAGGRFRYDIAADARYSQDDYQRVNSLGWTDLVHSYESYGPGLLDLEVNGASGVWGGFSSSHHYSTTLWGDGSPATFQIYDIYAQNNTGGLCVSVDRVLPDGTMFLPPITNADFALRNGSTLPIKFQVKYSGMPPLTPEQTLAYLTVSGPGGVIGTWSLADGTLKFNYETGAYVAPFHTKDIELVDGATYTAAVYDDATDTVLGTFSFTVDTEKGTSRGNSGK